MPSFIDVASDNETINDVFDSPPSVGSNDSAGCDQAMEMIPATSFEPLGHPGRCSATINPVLAESSNTGFMDRHSGRVRLTGDARGLGTVPL